MRIAKSAGKQKIFCIGSNKTGTTSLARAMKDLGFMLGEQRPAENLLRQWVKREFSDLIKYCNTAEAFQDIPFSLPYTYQALDLKFPNSKFILTVRDDSEQWYSSITRYHAKMFGGGEIPTAEDLKKADYCYPGWAYEAFHSTYNSSDHDLYNKEVLLEYYLWHNRCVREYFRFRKNDLLVLNVADDTAYRQLCEFLGKPCTRDTFPWENRTSNVEVRGQ